MIGKLEGKERGIAGIARGNREAPEPGEGALGIAFTLTFICHPGKTHNHRSRGDTPWRAQKVPPRALTRFSNFLWQGVGQAPPLPVKHKYTVLRIAYSCVLRIGGLGLWPALRNIPYNCFAYCVLRIEAWLLAHAGCAFCVLRFLRFGALQREQKAC